MIINKIKKIKISTLANIKKYMKENNLNKEKNCVYHLQIKI